MVHRPSSIVNIEKISSSSIIRAPSSLHKKHGAHVSPFALVLLIIAAALHAGWNFLVKRARERQIFAWLALVVGPLCFAPFVLPGAEVQAQVWLFVVASAVAESIYFIALTYAYGKADFSLVYPLARGAAPALLALWAVLFLGERLRAAGLLGLALLVLGLMVVGGAAWWARRSAEPPHLGGVLAALGVAGCISIYSAIDGAAVRHVDPLPYIVLVLALTAALLAPPLLLRYGRQAVAAEWRANWQGIALVGVATMLGYTFVLQAYAISGVSYAGAIREISVVFGALAGWRWLGEGFGATRTLGAGLIFLGILVIAVAG
jgi:drug/metabolite transporter (DMT)-like permease